MADANVKALYNAARRYWFDKFEARVRTLALTPPDKQDTISPILGEILTEIERAVPDDFGTEDEARRYLLGAGHRAKIIGTQEVTKKDGEVNVQSWEPNLNESDRAALEESRAAYLNYIGNLRSEQAVQAEPVLYRHVMSDTKRYRVGRKLAKHWEVDPLQHYWHPLWKWDEPLPPGVLAFQDAWFYKEVGVQTLRETLLHHGTTQVWEINESRLDPEYELDPRLCDFAYTCETYWSSRELDWLIYVSHESSITFAGEWLIRAMKNVWPNWEQRIYIDYDFQRPSDP